MLTRQSFAIRQNEEDSRIMILSDELDIVKSNFAQLQEEYEKMSQRLDLSRETRKSQVSNFEQNRILDRDKITNLTIDMHNLTKSLREKEYEIIILQNEIAELKANLSNLEGEND
jgi:chromosome segregation ATPase